MPAVLVGVLGASRCVIELAINWSDLTSINH